MILNIHERKIESSDEEHGLYFDESGSMPTDYRVSDLRMVERFSRDMRLDSVLRGAQAMVERAERQLSHPKIGILPERFVNGITRTRDLYQSILKAFENPTTASQPSTRLEQNQ